MIVTTPGTIICGQNGAKKASRPLKRVFAKHKAADCAGVDRAPSAAQGQAVCKIPGGNSSSKRVEIIVNGGMKGQKICSSADFGIGLKRRCQHPQKGENGYDA